jgi:hypothetical protein
MVTGNLIAESGSRVTIHGMVNGTVINRGGNVTIFGIVKAIANGAAGAVNIEPGAMIGGKKHGDERLSP